jgi:serine O-acetyltransferase
LTFRSVYLIQSKQDYRFYVESDLIALSPNLPPRTTLRQKAEYRLGSYASKNCCQFQQLLRKTEYRLNCSKNSFTKTYSTYLRLRLNAAGLKLGFEISPNCFGPGLAITHPGTIIVHPETRIGVNCRIHPGVVIGIGAGRSQKLPVIGDNVFIGPGAKIFGDVVLANGIAVGANSVVNSSFTEEGITIAGAPARKVSDKGSKYLLVYATEIWKKKHTSPKT